MDAKELLDQYAEYKAHADALRLAAEERRAEILKPVQQELDALEAEVAPLLAAAAENIAALEAQIKRAVIAAGETVQGAFFQAVYSKPRVSWDSKKLDGMMAIIPGLEAARSVGEPSVSIRANR